MRIACRGKSLQHQRGLVESSLASSDTLLPSMCKDADGAQELKLKIYEVAALIEALAGWPRHSFDIRACWILHRPQMMWPRHGRELPAFHSQVDCNQWMQQGHGRCAAASELASTSDQRGFCTL